ncbi:hypothetical protein EON73_03225 [bacterium]|nr:MAG: hypothetical protein EON73_03225 [bacterium]
MQPIAFALQQAQEDVAKYTFNFPDELLYERPGNAASVAFHLQHLTGVLDRMFTYAENMPLKEAQLNWLQSEGKAPEKYASAEELVKIFNDQIEISLQKLKRIDIKILTEPRAETPTHFISVGLDKDLRQAMKNATLNACNFIKDELGYTFNEALSICSTAVDFEVTQVVDQTMGVNAMIPKAIFTNKKFEFWNA